MNFSLVADLLDNNNMRNNFDHNSRNINYINSDVID